MKKLFIALAVVLVGALIIRRATLREDAERVKTVARDTSTKVADRVRSGADELDNDAAIDLADAEAPGTPEEAPAMA